MFFNKKFVSLGLLFLFVSGLSFAHVSPEHALGLNHETNAVIENISAILILLTIAIFLIKGLKLLKKKL